MKLLLANLPAALADRNDTIAECLRAMASVDRIREVRLFGSYSRGEAGADSDVDLCIVADGAASQLRAAERFRRAMRDIRGKPPFTLVPITPARLAEKRAVRDPRILIASED